jgi:hypothetical protein
MESVGIIHAALLTGRRYMGRKIILAGIILIVIGAILQFAPWLIHWFGRLPGDIRIETGRSKIYIPITSMILISVILTLLIHLFRR